MAASRPLVSPVVPWPAVHFVGVGGHSMSGLAAALARLGCPCSGSDLAPSVRTARASAAGVAVRIGHDGAAIATLPPGSLVVANTDVPADNPEVVAAQARGLTVAHRSVVLDWFLSNAGPQSVTVTGTHGKSTTTSLAALAALAGGLDPTVFVGADVPGLEGGNHRLGTGPVIAEADESDGSFVLYQPDVAVVTSAEPEHLEHYGGDFQAVLSAHAQFLSRIRPGGLAVLCADDARLRVLGREARADVLWYGLSPDADLRAVGARYDVTQTRFHAELRGRDLGPFRLRLPGRHNVVNTLGALGAALHLGCDPAAASTAIAGFLGPQRRFEVLASTRGITVVDDYAHNPTKVAAAIAGARQRARGRVLAIFQPHRYNRTAQLWEAFGEAFRGCDALWLTEIYAPAGEAALPGVSGAALAELVGRHSGVPTRFVPDTEQIIEEALAGARSGDLVLVMGAGSITATAHQLAKRLRAGRRVG